MLNGLETFRRVIRGMRFLNGQDPEQTMKSLDAQWDPKIQAQMTLLDLTQAPFRSNGRAYHFFTDQAAGGAGNFGFLEVAVRVPSQGQGQSLSTTLYVVDWIEAFGPGAAAPGVGFSLYLFNRTGPFGGGSVQAFCTETVQENSNQGAALPADSGPFETLGSASAALGGGSFTGRFGRINPIIGRKTFSDLVLFPGVVLAVQADTANVEAVVEVHGRLVDLGASQNLASQ